MTYQVRGKLICIECNQRDAMARKLCRPCYARHWHSGNHTTYDILGPGDVFLNRIKKGKSCWLWAGNRNEYGYGIFLMAGGKAVRAHRYSYEHFNGPIPKGLIVMHTCDNPPCVNPKHLKIGTRADNNSDTKRKKRHLYGLKHPQGILSDAQVRAIRKDGRTTYAIAATYGISQSYVSGIRSGKERVYVK